MSAMDLFEALDSVEDSFLTEANRRRAPSKKHNPAPVRQASKKEKAAFAVEYDDCAPMDSSVRGRRWTGISAAVLAIVVILSVTLVPLLMQNGSQLGTSNTGPSSVLPQVDTDHYHVIFQGFAQVDRLLLLEEQGSELTAYLKESGLYSQGVQTQEDVLEIRQIISTVPIPTLNSQEPDTLELAEGMEVIGATFENISLTVRKEPSEAYVQQQLSGMAPVDSNGSLYLDQQVRRSNGEHLFRFGTSAYDHYVSLTVTAADLESAVSMLSGLDFLYFGQWEMPVSGMAGMNAYWQFEEGTGTLRLFPGTYGLNEMVIEGCVVYSAETTGHIHGFSQPEDAPWYSFADQIKHVVVSKDMISIGRGVFRDLPNLQTVSLPTTLEHLGSQNFQSCAMDSLSIPHKTRYIGTGLGNDCPKLKVVVFHNMDWEQSGQFLLNCPRLEYLQCRATSQFWLELLQSNYHLAKTDTFCAGDALSAEDGWQEYSGHVQWRFDEATATLAFKGYWEISDTADGEYPWMEYKNKVRHLVLGTGITGTAPNAFPFPGLLDVYLPPTLKEMGNLMLSECSILRRVVIPNSVTELPNGLFLQCRSLEFVALPGELEKIGSMAFNGCTALGDIQIPDSVTFIGGSAFSNCSSLKHIKLPEYLRQIHQALFYECSGLDAVTLPAGIKLLDDNSFYGCTSLTDIYFGGTQEQWERVNISEYAHLPGDLTVHYTQSQDAAAHLRSGLYEMEAQSAQEELPVFSLNMTNDSFVFSASMSHSYASNGSFVIYGNWLTVVTQDGTFVFSITDDGLVLTSVPDSMTRWLQPGSRFVWKMALP